MDLPLSDFRQMSVAEFDTTKLLSHAARQAEERGYKKFPIVDVDSHHYESESIGEILDYMELWRVDPRQLFARGQPVWSLWFHVTDPVALAWCHGAILGVMLLFTLGVATRVTWTSSACAWCSASSKLSESQRQVVNSPKVMSMPTSMTSAGAPRRTFNSKRIRR